MTTMISMADSELTLANIALDLQITICIFLGPIDILALRKTCKALELTTRQRAVWVAALHRVCLDNTLFLPSFPIPDMSDLELEQAAMAPHRWIELCGGFKKRDHGNFGGMLCPRTTRIIGDVAMHPVPKIFLVPGGRFLVVATVNRLFVWDLGYVSNAHCTLIASVGLAGGSRYGLVCMVQVTPDNMGLIILVSNTRNDRYISIYEIYPQSKTPVLTQIAHIDWNAFVEGPAHLLSDTLIFLDFDDDKIVFRFWDYRANYSTCFLADVEVNKFECILETFATKTAIIIFCEEGILVWAIPPLSPHSPDHFLDRNPNRLPPLFRIPFPNDTVYPDIRHWRTISSWYFGSWDSIYFDILRLDSTLERFKLIVKPDLSDASLHVIDSSKPIHNFGNPTLQSCSRICEGTLVSLWHRSNNQKCGVYTGLLSTQFSCDSAIKDRMARPSRSLCPASGRFVYFTCDDDDNVRIVVADLI